MKIVPQKVNFRARVVIGFLTKKTKPIDVREGFVLMFKLCDNSPSKMDLRCILRYLWVF